MGEDNIIIQSSSYLILKQFFSLPFWIMTLSWWSSFLFKKFFFSNFSSSNDSLSVCVLQGSVIRTFSSSEALSGQAHYSLGFNSHLCCWLPNLTDKSFYPPQASPCGAWDLRASIVYHWAMSHTSQHVPNWSHHLLPTCLSFCVPHFRSSPSCSSKKSLNLCLSFISDV